MTTTPVLGLTELASAQAVPETTVNGQIRGLEQGAKLYSVKDRTVATPPGSPSDGDAYIVASSPTGAWTGKATYIAYYQSSAWQFIAPKEGMFAWNQPTDLLYYYTGSAWSLYSASGSGNKWRVAGGPTDNEAPASNYATLDTRNSHPTLDFDDTTQEGAVWTRVLPSDYAGTGLTVTIWCALTSATTGTVGWLVSIERMDASTLDIDADSFASANTVTAATVPGTSGQFLKMSVNISSGANMDSAAAGDLFRIKIERDVANDTAVGDAELLRWDVKEQ